MYSIVFVTKDYGSKRLVYLMIAMITITPKDYDQRII